MEIIKNDKLVTGGFPERIAVMKPEEEFLFPRKSYDYVKNMVSYKFNGVDGKVFKVSIKALPKHLAKVIRTE